MKERHAQWAKLTHRRRAADTPRSRPVIAIRDQPGVQDLERKLLLYTGRRTVLSPELDDLLEEVSQRLFGIVRDDTLYAPPPEYWGLSDDDPERWRIDSLIDDYERQLKAEHLPEPEALRHLEALGVSFYGQNGDALSCFRHFDRQAELAALKVKGSLPEPAEINQDELGSRLEAEARQWKSTRKQR